MSTSHQLPYCAVLGTPIHHSWSPRIHARFAEQFGMPLIYEAIDPHQEGFAQAVASLKSRNAVGVNVTLPYKRLAFELADQTSKNAKASTAVNTLTFRDGIIFGENTDGVGLVRDLHYHDVSLVGKRVLLLGAGGAAAGILPALLAELPSELHVANRTLSKAETLVDQFLDHRLQCAMTVQALHNIAGEFDLIINASSASLQHATLNLPTECIHSDTVVYDMMYAAQPTNFLQWSHSLGARQSLDGLGMLIEQAAASFFIWHGHQPNTTQVREEIRQQLHLN